MELPGMLLRYARRIVVSVFGMTVLLIGIALAIGVPTISAAIAIITCGTAMAGVVI
jgi:hypothetical protein